MFIAVFTFSGLQICSFYSADLQINKTYLQTIYIHFRDGFIIVLSLERCLVVTHAANQHKRETIYKITQFIDMFLIFYYFSLF